MMKSSLLLAVLLVLASCVTQPPREAYELRHLGDAEVVKLRGIAERNIIARYDGRLARVWRAWKAYEARVSAIEPAAALQPAEVRAWTARVTSDLAKYTRKRDAKLGAIGRKRSLELAQSRGLALNIIKATGGLLAGWDAQGRASAEMIQTLRESVVEGASIYNEYRAAKSLQKQAEEAAEAEASEGEE